MPTANQPVSAHARAPFGAPEMLEEILMHLDMRTLLTSAQGVNKTFYRLIVGSPRADYSTTSIANPLLMEVFPFCLAHLGLGPGEHAPLLAKSERAWNNALPFPSAEHIRANGQALWQTGRDLRRMLSTTPLCPVFGKSALILPMGQRLYSGRSEPKPTIDAESTSAESLQVRMPDLLGVVLRPIKASVAGRPEGTLGQAVGVIWDRVPLGSRCAAAESLRQRQSVSKVAVRNFGHWESISAANEPCAALYRILVRSGDGFLGPEWPGSLGRIYIGI
ncbi:hypothetical protein DL771_000992 [Monosporascus sp. 5C6A]|nr:hypothetical protein DL771_000992 [Monosporascus sp. 5C6A]